jgi:hypothetical protein
MDDKDDGFALSSICSEDNINNMNQYYSANNNQLPNDNRANDDSEDDSSDFNSENQDMYSDSPPHFHHQSPAGTPNKNINSLLSDNSEVEIDFTEDINELNSTSSSIRISEHHLYQEEQRYLFEQGNISDSGLEDEEDDRDNHHYDDDDDDDDDSNGDSNNDTANDRYECERYLGEEEDEQNRSRLSDNSTASSYSNAAAATYDANLRKLLGMFVLFFFPIAGRH